MASVFSVLASALQRGDGSLLYPHHGVVETVFVNHGGHALNAEVSLQQAAEVQRLSCRTSTQTGAPALLLAPPPVAVSSSLGLLLGEVQPLQLSLQLAGQGAESGPLPRRVGGGAAGQQRLRAGFSLEEAAVGSAALLWPPMSRHLGVGATSLLPPPPGAAPLRRGQPGPPQGAGGRSVSEERAQSSQHAGLRLQTAETQTARRVKERAGLQITDLLRPRPPLQMLHLQSYQTDF